MLGLEQFDVMVVDARIPRKGILNQFVAAVEVVEIIGYFCFGIGVVEELRSRWLAAKTKMNLLINTFSS